MMAEPGFFYLGRILKTFGNKGHLLALLDVDNPEEYLQLESVYLNLQGTQVPFFIEELEIKHAKKVMLRFQDVYSIADAEIYSGLEMYLPLNQLVPLEGDQFYFHEVKGYQVIDRQYGEIGLIEDVLELPHQSLFQIKWGDREILIPVVDEIIKQVDREHRIVKIEAPEGLIDIYL